VNRNRDVDWVRVLEKKSAERRIGVWAQFDDTPDRLTLTLTDEDGHSATAHAALPASERQLCKDPDAAQVQLRESIGKMGDSIFKLLDLQVQFAQAWFVPVSLLNRLRREALEALEAARVLAFSRMPRREAVAPAVPYPQGSLSYLANVLNAQAHAFYAKHGVQLIEPAFEALKESGEVSLMITKHCVRFSLSLCPKQAKGVTGVQGTVKAEPLQLANGKEKLTLRFDCKACEMHVVGKIKQSVRQQARTNND